VTESREAFLIRRFEESGYIVNGFCNVVEHSPGQFELNESPDAPPITAFNVLRYVEKTDMGWKRGKRVRRTWIECEGHIIREVFDEL
jgi:hypothetical protein